MVGKEADDGNKMDGVLLINIIKSIALLLLLACCFVINCALLPFAGRTNSQARFCSCIYFLATCERSDNM